MELPAKDPAPEKAPLTVKQLLSFLGAFFLGAVLLLAAGLKALDPNAFVEQVRAEGLDALLPATVIAYTALALEFGLGAALLLGLRRAWTLIPATGLVVFFLWLTGRAYWRAANGEATEGCGCFGHLVERSPAEAFWQDALLLVPALLLAWLARSSKGLPLLRLAAVSIVLLGGVAFAGAAPRLPLDNVATRLKPDVKVVDLCVGGVDNPERICLDAIVPELEAGNHWIVLSDLEAPALEDGLDRLLAESLSGAVPRLWIVSPATPEELQRFTWRWGPSADVRVAPEGLLRPLYRTMPRSFEVRDGLVTATFPGLPPLSENPV